jgi:hypothetical protein
MRCLLTPFPPRGGGGGGGIAVCAPFCGLERKKKIILKRNTICKGMFQSVLSGNVKSFKEA